MSSPKSKTFIIAAVIAVVLTIFMRSRFGDEVLLCEGQPCDLGSGTKWLATGLSLIGPFFAAAGFEWARLLENRNMLDPRAKWAVPDAEQILEGLAVLLAGLFTYWLILNGPANEGVDVRQVSAWANDLRNFRLEEGLPETNLVPARTTWFVIGAALAVPFFFSFGSMLGREVFGRQRNTAMAGESIADDGEADDDSDGSGPDDGPDLELESGDEDE